MTNDCNDSLNNFCAGLYSAVLVEKPCRVINVHSQYCVDVEYYDRNTSDILYQVPVKHMQTSGAYVFLGLSAGDYGTVRFFDTDTSEYFKGGVNTSEIIRKHNINDNVFTCGYYPAASQYAFPSGDLVIGTTSGSVINFSENSITITGGELTITGSSITLGENTTIDGKVFLEHTHENGNEGNPTGKVI